MLKLCVGKENVKFENPERETERENACMKGKIFGRVHV